MTSFIEDVIVEYAAIVREATDEHLAPNWTLDFIAGGLDAAHMRVMADRWTEWSFEPASFADRVRTLADDVENERSQ